MFGPEGEKLAGGGEIYAVKSFVNSYSSPDSIRVDETGGACSAHGSRKDVFFQ
jgi:hypothetical protein